MAFAEWQQRVIEEKTQLKERFDKLCAFLDTPAAGLLDPIDRTMLTEQYFAMELYLNILRLRIARFEEIK